MKAFIAGYDRDTIDLLIEFGYSTSTCRVAKGMILPECDLLVLTGGSDVYPPLYGQQNQGECYYDSDSILRDYAEEQLYHQAVAKNTPVFGICRGFQFINVMNRGTLRQHVTGHTGNYGHHFVYSQQEPVFKVNSYHHQQVVVADAVAIRILHSEVNNDGGVESAYFPGSNTAGVQWHPEWLEKGHPAREYVESLLARLQNSREERQENE